MEEEIAGDGHSWEESIYWNHFRSIHFYLPLSGEFQHQLGLPKKFVENMRSKLADTVVIKGPGRSTWRVSLAAQGDNLMFRDGWSEFVSDHKLKEHDLLFFKFIGESRFEVLVFDSNSFCEKEASYFLNRPGVENGSRGNVSPILTPNKADLASKDVENGPKVFDILPKKTWRKASIAASSDVDSGNSPITPTTSRKRPLAASPISSFKPKKKKTGEKKSDRCNLMSVKNQKTVTTMNQEQKLAVQSAQAAAVDGNSFIIVMRPTHVDKRFYLSIPVDWAHKHLKPCNQDIILRVNDRTWPTKYYFSSRKSGGLASGWKKFADDNGLQVPDVCLFKLADIETGPVCLDVTIFKSAQETPPAIMLDVEEEDDV